jgi:pimeloyl-ACP methyl ester carboxylesterase
MPYAPVNGQRLYYEDSGGSGPAIVFSHGILLDGSMFASQVAALRDRYRCITWDQRGHGNTAGETLAPFTYYDSAEDLAALLAFLDIDSAILAGVSQGAFLAMRCALVHPRIARALILIATQAGVDDPTTLQGYKTMLDAWIAHQPEAIGRTFETLIFGSDWPGAAAWREKWRAMTAPNLLACFGALAGRDDIGDKVSALPVPTLVVHGDADLSIPLAKAQALQRSLPKAELVVVEGAAHSPNLTHPVPVNAAIEAFLARHGLTS